MTNNLDLTEKQIAHILSPKAIREKAQEIFQLAKSGKTSFEYHPEKLGPTIDYVLTVIRKNYPALQIPFHSRWGHFRAGQIDRATQIDQLIGNVDPMERARIKLDLVITSVLLDAGAGMKWSYLEKETGKPFSKSEGLGVASFHMFLSGVMSSDRKSLRADSIGLQKVTARDLESYFQVSEKNPLVGVTGRVSLLNNLGRAIENRKLFKNGRPGNIVDLLFERYGKTIPAEGILQAVLEGFGSIWPGRLTASGKNLGDVWRHSALGAADSISSLVPFHKLSQWLTYSLIEPIEEAGLKVVGVQNLTGLAEYRNGGLFIDSGLISPRDASALKKAWRPDSELVIEWRALTIHLLDLVGEGVCKALGKSSEEFPLAKVLEGGTWWAGRFLAAEKRSDGGPPLQIESDGTVF